MSVYWPFCGAETATTVPNFLHSTPDPDPKPWTISHRDRTISTKSRFFVVDLHGPNYTSLRRPYIYNHYLCHRIAGPGPTALLEQFEKGKGGMHVDLVQLAICDDEPRDFLTKMFLTEPPTEKIKVGIIDAAERIRCFALTVYGGVKVGDLLETINQYMDDHDIKMIVGMTVLVPGAILVTEYEKDDIEKAGIYKVPTLAFCPSSSLSSSSHYSGEGCLTLTQQPETPDGIPISEAEGAADEQAGTSADSSCSSTFADYSEEGWLILTPHLSRVPGSMKGHVDALTRDLMVIRTWEKMEDEEALREE